VSRFPVAVHTSCVFVVSAFQVRQRFRDESIVEDLEQMGLRLTGMPEIAMPTINSVSNANVSVRSDV